MRPYNCQTALRLHFGSKITKKISLKNLFIFFVSASIRFLTVFSIRRRDVYQIATHGSQKKHCPIETLMPEEMSAPTLWAAR